MIKDRCPPSAFNPEQLDTEHWISAAKEAGMKYAVLTAKHHDGFSNWSSTFTEFSVANSPWKHGKGDVVKEFVTACRKYGIRPGLYYSPYDGSANFYHQDGKAYDDYFINQITELLSNYGDIDILWFDAFGSEGHEYDWTQIIDTIRTLQPEIMIFNVADPNFRWIGNEDGIAPIPCWNVTDSIDFSILSDKKESLGDRIWLPAECDVQMRDNWFYSDHDEHTVKSVEELTGIYYYSVGRGANLLLNIGPNRQGLLPIKDRERLLEFGGEIKSRFEHPIAKISGCELVDGKVSYLMTEPQIFDHVMIRENIRNGESIKRFKISIFTYKSNQPVTIYEGRNIGHKAIIRIPPIKAHGILLEIAECEGEPQLAELSLYHVGK